MSTRTNAERTWAIVLAGGEGTRLAALTEAVHGRPVPKQFASVSGDRSLLQVTLARIAPLVPSSQTVVVVGRAHLPWARAQLVGHAGPTLVQPASLGTATAILYALTWIRLQDPGADVLVFPSDHHVRDEPAFVEAVRAASAASRELDRIVLVGVAPSSPEPEYGWIVPGAAVAPACCALEGFVEKPSAEVARQLHAHGALWNSFILAAPVSALLGLATSCLPEHATRFGGLDRFSFAPGAPDLEALYGQLAPADFSKCVLQRAHDLVVFAMPEIGWNDWGTPERVLASLHGTTAASLLRRRLDAAARSTLASRRTKRRTRVTRSITL